MYIQNKLKFKKVPKVIQTSVMQRAVILYHPDKLNHDFYFSRANCGNNDRTSNTDY